MKKKRGFLLFTVMLVCFLAMPPAFAAKPIKLIFSIHMPDHLVSSRIDKWWMNEVEKRTNGRVVFKQHWSGELTRGRELLPQLRSGAIHISQPTQGYFPDELPLGSLVDMTRIPVDYTTVANGTHQVYWHEGEMSKSLLEEGRKQNFEYLFHYSVCYRCMMNKPIHRLSDLKGLRMRSVGPYEPVVLSKFGAVPVAVMPGEVYEALSRGTIDGICYPTNLIPGYKLHEVAKYANIQVAGCITWPCGMNLNTWNSLPDEVRDVFVKMRDEIKDRDVALCKSEKEKTLAFLKNQGCKFIELPAEEKEKLRKAWIEVAFDVWYPFVEKKGLAREGQLLLNKWLEITTGKGMKYWKAELGK